MAVNIDDQVVQTFEIVVVARQQDAIFAHGMREVNGVVLTNHADVGRDLHVVACLLQKGNQKRFGGIVVEIESHRRLFRARCCEGNHRSGRRARHWIIRANGVDQRLFAPPTAAKAMQPFIARAHHLNYDRKTKIAVGEEGYSWHFST